MPTYRGNHRSVHPIRVPRAWWSRRVSALSSALWAMVAILVRRQISGRWRCPKAVAHGRGRFLTLCHCSLRPPGPTSPRPTSRGMTTLLAHTGPRCPRPVGRPTPTQLIGCSGRRGGWGTWVLAHWGLQLRGAGPWNLRPRSGRKRTVRPWGRPYGYLSAKAAAWSPGQCQ